MKKETVRRIAAGVTGGSPQVTDVELPVRSEDGSAYDVRRIRCGGKDQKHLSFRSFLQRSMFPQR